jgi:hypothetical protein
MPYTNLQSEQAALPSCAYKGDVYLYSPQGAGNVIEKSVDADLDIPLLP